MSTESSVADRPPAVVANRLRMLRQRSDVMVLLVEGESDLRVWRDPDGRWRTWQAGCRNNVFEVLRLVGSSEERVLALVDRDFDWQICGLQDARVICYPDRDLEMWMLRQMRLSDLLEDMGSKELVSRAGGADVLLSRLIEDAEWLAAVRHTNAKHDLRFPFGKIQPSAAVDRATHRLERAKYLERLLAKRLKCETALSGGWDSVQKVETGLEYPDLTQAGPRGRDVLALVAAAIHVLGRKEFRTMKVIGVADVIESSLRAGATAQMLAHEFSQAVIARLLAADPGVARGALKKSC